MLSRPPSALNPTPVVLDTNIFVAAGFNANSSSAQLIEAVRSGHLQLVWNDQTYQETQHILSKIPPLRWQNFAKLFREPNRFGDQTDPEAFKHVPDPADRKFAALAAATGAILITLDTDLLSSREQAPVRILRPSEFLPQQSGA